MHNLKNSLPKNKLISNTLILMSTGFVTRFLGFIYKIFLSQKIGPSGMGLYQLIFPIYTLGIAFCSSGMEIAISKSVSSKSCQHRSAEARSVLFIGAILSSFLSILTFYILQNFADEIAVHFLHNRDCKSLLIILAYVFPLSAIHNCICGYYFGNKDTVVPAISLFIEQFTRIASVLVLFYFVPKTHQVSAAVLGLIIGETFALGYCILSIRTCNIKTFISKMSFTKNIQIAKELICTSLPITGNKFSLHILQSFEAISIPFQLQIFGETSKNALASYGTLTGMAIPCILFPSAITNAISVTLLPVITECITLKSRKKLQQTVRSIVFISFAIGIFCWFFFFLFGQKLGALLFPNTDAGTYISSLSWLCPFLYTSTILLTTINGMGYPHYNFLLTICSLSIRILFLVYAIPAYGLLGYILGLLISHIFLFISSLIFVSKKIHLKC